MTDSVTIKSTAISTQTIHGYDIAIERTNDTTTYFFQHIHDFNDTLVINKKWKGELKTGTDIEAVVTLYLDYEGHTKTQKLAFKVQ